MTRIQKAFGHGKAFIPFITAGYPSLEITEKLILEMAKSGADIIEIGIPFSDPVAEGPVIQEADERALSAGTTTDGIFEMVKRIRKTCDIPLAFMTYLNPIFVYGREKFVGKCHSCGVDAIIVPDMPYEEKDELFPFCEKYRIALISLIAPNSKDRTRMIAKEAQGFLYCVSSLGVTGVRENIKSDIKKIIATVREVSDIPCAVGFGVSTPEQASYFAQSADGIIVGSAIIKMIAKHGEQAVPYVAQYVREMKKAIIGK